MESDLFFCNLVSYICERIVALYEYREDNSLILLSLRKTAVKLIPALARK